MEETDSLISKSSDPQAHKNPSRTFISPNSTYEQSKKAIFTIVTLVSFSFLLVTSWLTIFSLVKYKQAITFILPHHPYSYFPINQSVFMFWLLNMTVALVISRYFVFYLAALTFKRDEHFINALFKGHKKYHFIPYILQGCLFLIGEIGNKNGQNLQKQMIAGLTFCPLTLLFLLVFKILFNKDLKNSDVNSYKKVLFSALVAYDLYYLFYCIAQMVLYDVEGDLNKHKNIGVLFIILMAIFAVTAVVIFNDFTMSFVHFLINLGVVVFHYKLDKNYRDMIELSSFEAVFAILMCAVYAGTFAFSVCYVLREESECQDDFAVVKKLRRNKST